MTTHSHHKWGQTKRARWGHIKLTFPQLRFAAATLPG